METSNIIGGDRIRASSGRELAVLDPATDEVVASVPDGGGAEATLAVDAAARAFEEWRRVPPSDRATVMRGFAESLISERERLGLLLSREQGKPVPEAMKEVDYAASFLPIAADAAEALQIENLDVPGKAVEVHHRPVGICAAVTPWNFPLAMIAKKSAPAMASGSVQVIKPAEQTPLSAIAFVELAEGAGIPPGVLNVVTGDAADIGRTLLGDRRVRKLSFTGSTEVGRLLMREASQGLQKLSLELGGHAPFLVFEDASMERAVEVAMTSKFRNAGQTCVCPNRFLVHHSRHDEFVERLCERASSLVSGRGDAPGVDLGPLIDDRAVRKVEEHVADAVSRGAAIACGGGRRTLPGLTDRFPEPTVLLDAGPGMRCWTEETFGPVCPVRAFSEEEEAIEIANASEYGLASYAVTTDHARIRRLGSSLETGIIGINDGVPAIASVPFGGLKQSGFGREGGRWGVEEYLETVTVSSIP